MNITILNVAISEAQAKNGAVYKIAEVAFKNNTFGKVESKKVTSYSKEAFDVLALAKSGETYEVDVKKNEKTGYNDWMSLKKSTATGPVQQSQSAPPAQAGRSNSETPEERAKRQVYIVRQSSIASAVSALSVGAKSAPSSDLVIEVAKKFEKYVFGTEFNSSTFDGPALPADLKDPQID